MEETFQRLTSLSHKITKIGNSSHFQEAHEMQSFDSKISHVSHKLQTFDKENSQYENQIEQQIQETFHMHQWNNQENQKLNEMEFPKIQQKQMQKMSDFCNKEEEIQEMYELLQEEVGEQSKEWEKGSFAQRQDIGRLLGVTQNMIQDIKKESQQNLQKVHQKLLQDIQDSSNKLNTIQEERGQEEHEVINLINDLYTQIDEQIQVTNLI